MGLKISPTLYLLSVVFCFRKEPHDIYLFHVSIPNGFAVVSLSFLRDIISEERGTTNIAATLIHIRGRNIKYL